MCKTNSRSVFLVLLFLAIPAASTPRFPVSNSDRPFTLPSQIAEIDLMATFTKLSNFSASLEVNYGITDNWQVKASYDGVTLRDFETVEAEKAFHIGTSYFVLETPYFASMIDVDFPLYVEANWAQNIKFAFPTAFPLWRAARLGMSVLQAGFIDFQFAPYVAADINIPAKISWQATEGLSLAIGTNFVTFNINRPDGNGGTLGHDYIWTKTPLYLHALYGFSDVWDLIARIGFHDLQRDQGDNFYVWLGIGFRFGRMSN